MDLSRLLQMLRQERGGQSGLRPISLLRALKQMISHGKKTKQRHKHSHGISRKNTEKTEAETCKRNTSGFGFMNDFKAHGLRSMGLLFLNDWR